mmetsp:Transcript_9808/g.22095  ORF Transcript_9808/g.22095 Transcript_9808/m.22095 type:complete len:224 (-) Transcript_9808:284-955(-)
MFVTKTLRAQRISSSLCNSWTRISPKSSIVLPSRSPYFPQLIRTNNQQHGSRVCWQRWNSSSSGGGGNKGPTVTVAKSSNKISQASNQQSSSSSSSSKTTFLERFFATKPMPPRNTPRWYGEMALICTVFGITGSSTMFLVRPAVSNVLGLQGSMKDGPWSYRICSLVIMTPMYSALLVIVGTVFGRHAYFRHFSVKMFSRFGVPPELMDKNFHLNAKNFKKW